MSNNWSPRARYFMLIILIILFVLVAWYIRPLFQPLVIAALFAYVLSPVVDFLEEKARMRHKVAVNLVYFLALASIIAIPATIVPILVGEVQGILSDLTGLPSYIENLFSQPLVIGGFTLSLSEFTPDLIEPLTRLIEWVPENTIKLIEATSRNVAWILVIIITTYHFINDWDKLRDWLFRLAPKAYQEDMRRLYTEIANIWSIYLRGQIVLMVILGVIYALAWSVIGLPGAFLLGALAGLLNIIPELGPFIAAVLALSVALVEGSTYLEISNMWFALLTLGVYVILNYGKNIWLLPKMFGRSLKLHDGIIFVAIITAVVINGILGVLIVVPLLASVMVVGKYLRRRIFGLPPFPEDDPEEELALVNAETEMV